MKTEYQIIAVDFDGTLCTDCFPKIGQPNTALIELLKGLRRQGRQIILWTCRCGNQLEEAVEWCRKWELEFDAVNEVEWRGRLEGAGKMDVRDRKSVV